MYGHTGAYAPTAVPVPRSRSRSGSGARLGSSQAARNGSLPRRPPGSQAEGVAILLQSSARPQMDSSSRFGASSTSIGGAGNGRIGTLRNEHLQHTLPRAGEPQSGSFSSAGDKPQAKLSGTRARQPAATSLLASTMPPAYTPATAQARVHLANIGGAAGAGSRGASAVGETRVSSARVGRRTGEAPRAGGVAASGGASGGSGSRRGSGAGLDWGARSAPGGAELGGGGTVGVGCQRSSAHSTSHRYPVPTQGADRRDPSSAAPRSLLPDRHAPPQPGASTLRRGSSVDLGLGAAVPSGAGSHAAKVSSTAASSLTTSATSSSSSASVSSPHSAAGRPPRERMLALPPAPPGGGDGSGAVLKCDKCDGKHQTNRCPHFPNERDDHPDARLRRPSGLGSGGDDEDGRAVVLVGARIRPQPGDGNCLFHSLCHGLRDGSSAGSLRREIASWIEAHADTKISSTPLKEWVRWDSGTAVGTYARRMSAGGQWGGGIELAAVSQMKRVNVSVYEQGALRGSDSLKRISQFVCPDADVTVNVLYRGGVHYDALEGGTTKTIPQPDAPPARAPLSSSLSAYASRGSAAASRRYGSARY